jgi:hypothetical protein
MENDRAWYETVQPLSNLRRLIKGFPLHILAYNYLKEEHKKSTFEKKTNLGAFRHSVDPEVVLLDEE